MSGKSDDEYCDAYIGIMTNDNMGAWIPLKDWLSIILMVSKFDLLIAGK